MCGIAGVWRKRDPIGSGDLSDVVRMMRALAHRGPDDHRTWNDARLTLGHRRLTIIDPSPAAGEPMLTASGDGVLCYNGEVYNFRALRKTLEAEGLTFRTVSDTEVVLQALHHWGPQKAVPLFDGMFSFAYSMPATVRCGLPGTGWASSRCRSPKQASASCSPPRTRRSSPAKTSDAGSTRAS
ncbi:MAG: hypothetical protein HOQ25_04590 [Mesorhizobium sp.]|nr:hypothetical protein [Mesorhizobium sp.]